jgi:hypothetical protein
MWVKQFATTAVCLKTIVNPLMYQFFGQITDSYPNIKTTSIGY